MNIIRLQGDVEKRNGIFYEYDADAVPLGEGGMGRVFKGFRVVERTGERIPVAIKAIYENIPERVVERARREAEIQLENDNLIRMYGFVETPVLSEGVVVKVYYHVIMELLVGVTLESMMNGVVIDQNGMQIPYAAELYNLYVNERKGAVIRIMKAVLSGLMALHDKGYIHRDIDPSNIMITIDKKIKLIDFGICKQIVTLGSIDKGLTATGVFMGKVNYAAPELVLGDVKNQNYTTDIYALGIMLYQLYTGHLPFNGTDQDILAANLRTPLPMKDVRDMELRSIIRKATDKIQAKRYLSVAELRVDLERASVQTREGASKKMIVGVVVGVSAVLILVAGLTLLGGRKDENGDLKQPERVISKNELYHNAIDLLQRKDSVSLQLQGKEMLRQLCEDSLYVPAQVDYYALLLNSTNTEEVKKGYEKLKQIAEETSDPTAMFECGLTLSKGNRHFSVPTIRQSMLQIDVNLEQANQWLYRVMNLNASDYRSVYWAFNNLMERKISGELPAEEDKVLTELFAQFKARVDKYEGDATAELYRKAIQDDEETLRVWGLIK